MLALGAIRTHHTLSAEDIASHLGDATIEDIHHHRYLGGTAYPDMLDATDAVLSSEEGFTLMGLFRVTRTLGDIKKGSVVVLHKRDESTASDYSGTFVLNVDTDDHAVTFEYPNFTGCIADKLVAAEGLRKKLLLQDGTEAQADLKAFAKYPDNHTS